MVQSVKDIYGYSTTTKVQVQLCFSSTADIEGCCPISSYQWPLA